MLAVGTKVCCMFLAHCLADSWNEQTHLAPYCACGIKTKKFAVSRLSSRTRRTNTKQHSAGALRGSETHFTCNNKKREEDREGREPCRSRAIPAGVRSVGTGRQPALINLGCDKSRVVGKFNTRGGEVDDTAEGGKSAPKFLKIPACHSFFCHRRGRARARAISGVARNFGGAVKPLNSRLFTAEYASAKDAIVNCCYGRILGDSRGVEGVITR